MNEHLWYNPQYNAWTWTDLFLNYKEGEIWRCRKVIALTCGGFRSDGSNKDKPALNEYKAYGGDL